MLPYFIQDRPTFPSYARDAFSKASQAHLSNLCKGCLFQDDLKQETTFGIFGGRGAGGLVWKLGTHTREGRKARKSYVCVSVYGMVFASTFLLRGSPAPNRRHSSFTQSRSDFYFIMRSGRIRFLLSHDSDDEDRWHPVVRLGPGDGGRPAFLFFSSVHH